MTIAEPQVFDANGLPANAAPAVDARQEWLEQRRGAIGASDVAAILGISPWKTAWEVWADKTGKVSNWAGNDATRAGQAFESGVLDVAEDQLGLLERNVRVVHREFPLAATLDARVVSSGEPVEAKTTGLTGKVMGDWGDALTDQVPDHYLCQLHAQLICTGAEMAYLFALIAGRGVVKYQCERSDRLASQLTTMLTDWWERHIVRGIEPELRTPPALSVVKRLRKEAGKSIELTSAEASLMEQRASLKEQEKSLREQLEAVDSQILLALGDAEEGVLPDGTRLTHFERSRKAYTVEASTYRQIQVVKPRGKK
jgi:putative phage-type endonuclease